MKIEIVEFVQERFTVEIDDDTPEDQMKDVIEAARVAYEGPRSADVVDTNWDCVTETHDDIANLLIRFRPDHPGFDTWLSEHDRECWNMYIKDRCPAGGLHLSYKLWRAGDESHNPREMARVLKEGA